MTLNVVMPHSLESPGVFQRRELGPGSAEVLEATRLVAGHGEGGISDRTTGNRDIQKTLDLCGWRTGPGVTETTIPLPPLESFEACLDRPRRVAEDIMPKIG